MEFDAETIGRIMGASLFYFLPAMIAIGVLVRTIFLYQRRKIALKMARAYIDKGRPMPDFLRHEFEI